MMTLFIEGYPVDVNESFSTLITMAIDDVRQFGSRNTTFSKTIILPGTKRNNRLFGNIYEINQSGFYNPLEANANTNFNPAVSASCYIFNDNLQTVKGIARLLEVVVTDGFIEYEVAVFGELGGFVAKVGNKKLEELDFSAYDHVLNATNITGSWDTIDGNGYYYPLIDYGTYSTNKHDWKFGTFRPGIYVKETLEKIFADAGYTHEADLFSTDRFKSLIVPHSQKFAQKLSTTLLNATFSGSQVINTAVDYVEFGTAIGGSFTITLSNSQFAYNVAGTLTVNHRLFIAGSAVTDGTDGYISITVNSVQVASLYIPDQSGGTFFFGQYINYTGNLSNTDVVRIEVTRTNIGVFTVTVTDAIFTITTDTPTWVTIDYGDTVEMNSLLPKNILQKDFISSIMKLFNLYLFEDKDTERLIKIKPFTEFYLDAEAVDWSSKIDRSRPLKIKPMSELNSRYFNFNYKDDTDYYNDLYKKRYNKTYGSYKYDSEYEFANETTNVDLIFSGTPLVGYTSEDKKYSTIMKRTGDTTITEECIDSNIRILQAKKITGVTNWEIKDSDGTTTISVLSAYGYAGHVDDPDTPTNDLNFGVPEELFTSVSGSGLSVNQFNLYWSPYMAEITDKDSRLLTCSLKLSYKDVYNLDFSKLIWIDGVLYRLNKLEDFNVTNEDVCKAELLKVINRIY